MNLTKTLLMTAGLMTVVSTTQAKMVMYSH